MVATILFASGGWALVRSDGLTGGGSAEFAWRWTETSEERLLARAVEVLPDLPSAPLAAETADEPQVAQPGEAPAEVASPPEAAEVGADWPGFRGPDRDRRHPRTCGSRPTGLGRLRWSYGAGRLDLVWIVLRSPRRLFLHPGATWRRRGRLLLQHVTGEPVWRHRDTVRFWEAIGGAGPRAIRQPSATVVCTHSAPRNPEQARRP